MALEQCGMNAWIEDAALHALTFRNVSKPQNNNDRIPPYILKTNDGREIRISRKPKVAQVLALGGVGFGSAKQLDGSAEAKEDDKDHSWPPYLIIHDGKTYATLFLATFEVADSAVNTALEKGALIRVTDWAVNTVLGCAGPRNSQQQAPRTSLTTPRRTTPRRSTRYTTLGDDDDAPIQQSDAEPFLAISLPLCLSVAAPIEVLSKNGGTQPIEPSKLTDLNSSQPVTKSLDDLPSLKYRVLSPRLMEAQLYLEQHNHPKNISHSSLSSNAISLASSSPNNSNRTTTSKKPKSKHFDKKQSIDPNHIITIINSDYQISKDIQFTLRRFERIIQHSIELLAASLELYNIHPTYHRSYLTVRTDIVVEVRHLQVVSSTLIIAKINFLQQIHNLFPKHINEIIQTYEIATIHPMTNTTGKIWSSYALFTWKKLQDLDMANQIFQRALVQKYTGPWNKLRSHTDIIDDSPIKKKSSTTTFVIESDEYYSILCHDFLKFSREYKKDTSITLQDLQTQYNIAIPKDKNDNDDDGLATKEANSSSSSSSLAFNASSNGNDDGGDTTLESKKRKTIEEKESRKTRYELRQRKRSVLITSSQNNDKRTEKEAKSVTTSSSSNSESIEKIPTTKKQNCTLDLNAGKQSGNINRTILENHSERIEQCDINHGISAIPKKIFDKDDVTAAAKSQIKPNNKQAEKDNNNNQKESGNVTDSSSSSASSSSCSKLNKEAAKMTKSQIAPLHASNSREQSSKVHRGNQYAVESKQPKFLEHTKITPTDGQKNNTAQNTNSDFSNSPDAGNRKSNAPLEKLQNKHADKAMCETREAANSLEMQVTGNLSMEGSKSQAPRSAGKKRQNDGPTEESNEQKSSSCTTSKVIEPNDANGAKETKPTSPILVIIDDSDDDDDSIGHQGTVPATDSSNLTGKIAAFKNSEQTNKDRQEDNEKDQLEDNSALSNTSAAGKQSNKARYPEGDASDYYSDSNASMREINAVRDIAADVECTDCRIHYDPHTPTPATNFYGKSKQYETPYYSSDEVVLPSYCLEISIHGFSKTSLMLTLSPDGKETMTVGRFTRDILEKHLAGECLIPICQSALADDEGKVEGTGVGSKKSVSICYGDGYCSKIILMGKNSSDSKVVRIPGEEEEDDAIINMSLCFAIPSNDSNSIQSPCCAPSSLIFSQLQHFLTHHQRPTPGCEGFPLIQVIAKKDGPSWIACSLDYSSDSDYDSGMDLIEEREDKAIKKHRARKRKRQMKKKKRVWEIHPHRTRSSTIQKMKLLKRYGLDEKDSKRKRQEKDRKRKRT